MPKIDISNEAMSYFKLLAEPLVDTTVSVVDRIVNEHKHLKLESFQPSKAKDLEMHFTADHLPSVKFTSIFNAKVAGKQASQNYWNNILDDVIAAAVQSGAASENVRSNLAANTVVGEKAGGGYRYIADAGFSYQGIEANRVLKNIAKLCSIFGLSVDIGFKWQDNESAAHPGSSARVVLP